MFRGNEEQFDRFLTRVSALCGCDRVGLDEYGPPARIDAYDEEHLRVELALWTGGVFALITDEPMTSAELEGATRLAFLEMQRQFVDTLVRWGLRPRGSAEEAAIAISELCGLLCELANLQIPLQEVTYAWIASLQAQGKLRPDSNIDAEELTWTRAVARELVGLS